jgi:hypothetical protein
MQYNNIIRNKWAKEVFNEYIAAAAAEAEAAQQEAAAAEVAQHEEEGEGPVEVYNHAN